MEGDRYEGTVVSWKDKWGWVKCEEFPDGDIFAHIDDLKSPTMLQVGVSVSFELGTDAKTGKPRALQIRTANGAAQGKSGGKGRSMNNSSALSCVGRRMEGTVTSWKNDWGWISAGFADDVFAHHSDMKNGTVPTTGAQIKFTIGVDEKTGRARALEIMPMRASMPSIPMRPSVPRGGAQLGGLLPGLGTFANFVGQPMQGQVTSWKDQWGWISVPGFQEDIFAHSSDSVFGVAPMAGSLVSFVVGMKGGKARAMQIQSFTMQMPGANLKRKALASRAVPGKTLLHANATGEAMEGEVVSFKAPWGWISCPSFGSDLFAHMDDFAPGLTHLEVGQAVSFTAAPDPSKAGRWRAIGINIAGMAPAKRRKVGMPSVPRDKGFENAEGSVLSGAVVSWKDKWGWISAGEEFDGDLFAHVDDVIDGDLESGTAVMFTVGKDEKGRWRAREISVA